ncbi:EAL domain-containing protein [Achromobacter sp. K91]|nr:EAL domain-containing protein [Achromobacter sp. K91]RIJ02160.1 EAL domain-containing protein [Achromobacter sp. K91]
MEALMRWNSAEYGQVPPSDFVPLAERTGAIMSMGAWALATGCQQ